MSMSDLVAESGFGPRPVNASPRDEVSDSDLRAIRAAGFEIVQPQPDVYPKNCYYWSYHTRRVCKVCAGSWGVVPRNPVVHPTLPLRVHDEVELCSPGNRYKGTQGIVTRCSTAKITVTWYGVLGTLIECPTDLRLIERPVDNSACSAAPAVETIWRPPLSAAAHALQQHPREFGRMLVERGRGVQAGDIPARPVRWVRSLELQPSGDNNFWLDDLNDGRR